MVCQDIWDGVGVSDVLERSGRSLEGVRSGGGAPGGKLVPGWWRLAVGVPVPPRPLVRAPTTGAQGTRRCDHDTTACPRTAFTD